MATTKATVSTWSELVACDRPAVSATEVAKILGLDPRTVSRAIEDGEIPAVKIGRQQLVPKNALLKMFAA
jgi:excisionase family DNA binding protein